MVALHVLVNVSVRDRYGQGELVRRYLTPSVKIYLTCGCCAYCTEVTTGNGLDRCMYGRAFPIGGDGQYFNHHSQIIHSSLWVHIPMTDS